MELYFVLFCFSYIRQIEAQGKLSEKSRHGFRELSGSFPRGAWIQEAKKNFNPLNKQVVCLIK
jgi:hypothetical protein